jgi:hypothetical protein
MDDQRDKQEPREDREVFDKTGDLPRGTVYVGADPEELEQRIRGGFYQAGYSEGMREALVLVLSALVFLFALHLWFGK